MMKISSHFLISITCLLGLGCESRFADVEKSLGELLSKHNSESFFKNGVVLIVPIDGCNSCIKQSIDYYWGGVDTVNVAFVFGGLGEKAIKIKIGEENMERANVLLDKTDDIHKLRLADVTPRVFFLYEGKLVRVIDMTENNSLEIINEIKEFNSGY